MKPGHKRESSASSHWKVVLFSGGSQRGMYAMQDQEEMRWASEGVDVARMFTVVL